MSCGVGNFGDKCRPGAKGGIVKGVDMPEFRALLSGSGEMGERIRAFDWSSTALGPLAEWTQSLRTALGICLHSSIPSAIYWGPDYLLLYNDAWKIIAGPSHPEILGKPAREARAETWHIIGPRVRKVRETGKGFSCNEDLIEVDREQYWDFSLAPIIGEDGKVGGVLSQSRETTDRVHAQRRAALLLDLHDGLRRADKNIKAMIAVAAELLARNIGAAAVMYAEVDDQSERLRIVNGWSRDGIPGLSSEFHKKEYWTEGFANLMTSLEPQLINDVLQDPRTANSLARPLWATANANIRSMVAASVVRNGVCCAMLFATDDHPQKWTNYHGDLVRTVAYRLQQEITHARAESAIRTSEERHRLLFEQARDSIITMDLNLVITSCNAAAAAALETTPDALIGRSIAEFQSPEAFQRSTEYLKHKLMHGGTTRNDVEVIADSGRVLHWDASSALITDRDGNVVGVQTIARDISERKAFEAQQQLLINELNHRVKNTLALVQGLALQTFKAGRDPAEARHVFQERLAALAAAHDLLTREKWEGATLDELVVDALHVHADHPERFDISGPRVLLSPKSAISLVLALHELGTNAAKYGALSVPGGRVKVSWRQIPDGRLRIEWREHGGPPVKPPRRSGFGLRMIERALKSDLAGCVKIVFDPAGLICTIDAPDPASAVEGKAA